MAVSSPGDPNSSADGSARNLEGADKTWHLLDKTPPELRLLIYEAYFATFKLDYSTIDTYTSLQPPLLHVCKLIRGEALAAYEARVNGSKRTICETQELERQRGDREYDERGGLDASKEEHAFFSRMLVKQLKTSMKANRAHGIELSRIQVVRGREMDPGLAKWLNTIGRKLGSKMAWSIEDGGSLEFVETAGLKSRSLPS